MTENLTHAGSRNCNPGVLPLAIPTTFTSHTQLHLEASLKQYEIVKCVNIFFLN